MVDVFMSYANQDRQSVGKITRALTDRHLSVWSDQKIRAGEEWMQQMETALAESKVLVFCVSPSFLNSDWAQFEIGVALSRSRHAGVRVIPLILRESDLPVALSRFQHIDGQNMSADQVADAIEKVVEESY